VLVQLEFVAMGLWWLIVAKGVGLVVVVLGSLQGWKREVGCWVVKLTILNNTKIILFFQKYVGKIVFHLVRV
jgi:hypothetical protein